MNTLFIITITLTVINLLFTFVNYAILDHILHLFKIVRGHIDDKINSIHLLIQRYIDEKSESDSAE